MKRIAIVCFILIITLSMFVGTALAAAEYTESVAPYAVLLMDADSQQILFGQHIDDVIEPASTTKILTCILALENSSPDDDVVISEKAAGTGGSSLELITNESVKMSDLLNGMMMVSGNDAAVAVAEHIAGSVSAFADMMNAKAQEIGMTNSNFVTPHGMHIEEGDHHSTARDMAALTVYALKNPQFADIVSKSSYTMPKDNKKPKRTVKNTNKLLADDSYQYQYATGVKTGSTPAAGDCLVASASKDGMNLICLVFKDESKGGSDRWTDTKKLFEWGFENKKTIDVSSLINAAGTAQVQVENYGAEDPGAGQLDLKASVAGAKYVTLDKAIAEGLQSGTDSLVADQTYNAEPPFQAPIKEGDVLGTVIYSSKANGEEVCRCDLVASRDVAEAKSENTGGSVAAIATLPPTPSVNAVGQSKIEIWYWFIVPGALVAALIVRLAMTRKRFKKRKMRYSYRIK